MKAYLVLLRPANIITAIADIMMGFFAAHALLDYIAFKQMLTEPSLYLLICSTIGLYGGGVVFNDIFDRDLDKIERPERPLPSGKVSLKGAIFLGIVLLLSGIFFAALVSNISLVIAVAIALLALLYDKFSKHHPLTGPLNMGACRSGNLLLGISSIPEQLPQLWFLSIIPLIYIGAITMISREEVYGGKRNSLKRGAFFYGVVILFILSIKIQITSFNLLNTSPFLILFTYLIFKPLFIALKDPKPLNIKKAVKGGILSLIVLNATIAAGFAGVLWGVIILSLLPISIMLAKKFAVT